MGDTQTKPKKHANERSLTFWCPQGLADQLDAHLAALAAKTPGTMPSRQGLLISLIRRHLSDAAHPALAAHRGRLAEAAALDAAESSIGPSAGPTDAA